VSGSRKVESGVEFGIGAYPADAAPLTSPPPTHRTPPPQTSSDAPLPLDDGPWPSMTPEGRDFVKRCLARDWSQRLTAEQALHHPWWVGGVQGLVWVGLVFEDGVKAAGLMD